MTPYGLVLHLCGATYAEAARLHGVREDTVRSWATGRRAAPPRVRQDLALLWRDIRAASERIRVDHPDAVIEAMAEITDDGARREGLPLAAAWRQAIALALVRASETWEEQDR